MEDRIRKIIEGWYIYENALFEISLTHRLKENRVMMCHIRSGHGRIEYNPDMLKPLDDKQLEALLRMECIRIALKHPYDRQPTECSAWARLTASDIIIAEHYQIPELILPRAADFGFEDTCSFEWYAYHLPEPKDEGNVVGFGNISAVDATALWREDQYTAAVIDTAIARIAASNNWGTLPGSLVELIRADRRGRIDYRKVLAGFRASILTSQRNLTRMRPNRRTGFTSMGSIRQPGTRLLVAVDVSGSISEESLRIFLSVVNKAFRYGIERFDLLTFDAAVQDVMDFRKPHSQIKITGGGGTDFQPAVDYAHRHRYDGLLIFTDGEAPAPELPLNPRFKIAWVFDTRENMERYADSLRPLGRCCAIEL